MKLIYTHPHLSINGPLADADLADFVVLSGPNGSGKSQLLVAIREGHVRVDDMPPGEDWMVRHFAINELVALTEGRKALSAVHNRWLEFERLVEDLKKTITQESPELPGSPDRFDNELRRRLVQNRNVISDAGYASLESHSSKRLVDFTHDDFRRYVPILFGAQDPFQVSINDLFLTYHGRLINNDFLRFLQQRGTPQGEPLTDMEFTRQFGEPPWTLLNDILCMIGLAYRFVEPEGVEENYEYEVRLRHDDGTEIRTGELSSGEKTLLAVAMSLYTGSQQTEAIRLPQVLLLDEPDASLHPSMINSLLRVLRETFVALHGVKVILTTHSPTTVALAPEDSLYVMRRAPDPRVRAANSRDEALSSLTVGLSTLSVRVDNRRTVFVESEYDESNYQELFRLLKPQLGTELSLEFIASGRGGQGSAEQVKHLVTSLRNAGNTNVQGVVDRDGRAGAPDGVVFNAERYAIENVVLDPLVLGAFLLRERTVSNTALGVPDELQHFQLEGSHAQAIIDAVSKVVSASDDETNSVAVKYNGGFTAKLPAFWLNMRGHDLKYRICAAYPALKGERNLMFAVISKGFHDLPTFVPQSLIQMLLQLLGDTMHTTAPKGDTP